MASNQDGASASAHVDHDPRGEDFCSNAMADDTVDDIVPISDSWTSVVLEDSEESGIDDTANDDWDVHNDEVPEAAESETVNPAGGSSHAHQN